MSVTSHALTARICLAVRVKTMIKNKWYTEIMESVDGFSKASGVDNNQLSGVKLNA